jgi:DNA-binding NarL/FixJ family response regulator
MRELNILIASDHPLIRLGLRTLLEAQPGWNVVAEAVTGREAVSLALEHRPNLVITSILLPEINGLDAARQIRRELPMTEVLILTTQNSDKLMAEAFSAGARGYVLKTDNLRLLLTAVETISQHSPFISGSASGTLLGGLEKVEPAASKGFPSRRSLSAREREIVQRLAEGASNKEIAAALNISVNTVNAHRTNVMRMLDFHSVTELVRYAIREGLIGP